MVTRTRPVECCSLVVPPPLPDDERERMVGVFRALGDATRLDVFRLIAAQPEPLCVCDIVDRFTVSQPTISHHLKVLRDAGLVTVSRRGIWAYYAATPEGLAVARRLLSQAATEVATGIA